MIDNFHNMKTFFIYLWYDKHVPNIYNRIRFPVRIQIEKKSCHCDNFFSTINLYVAIFHVVDDKVIRDLSHKVQYTLLTRHHITPLFAQE